jgi:hypothetical protein
MVRIQFNFTGIWKYYRARYYGAVVQCLRVLEHGTRSVRGDFLNEVHFKPRPLPPATPTEKDKFKIARANWGCSTRPSSGKRFIEEDIEERKFEPAKSYQNSAYSPGVREKSPRGSDYC